MTRIGFAYNQKPEQATAGGGIVGAARFESRADDEPPSPIPAQDDVYAEWDSADTIDAVANALAALGDVVRLEANDDFPQRLRDDRPDIVFNIAEGLRGPNREAHVPAICEFFGIPYSGSDPFTLSLCLDKARTKETLCFHGVPIPPTSASSPRMEATGAELRRRTRPRHRSPVPRLRQADPRRIVEGNHRRELLPRHPSELEAQVEFLLDRYDQPVLVEAYLPGAEFTCAVLGNGIGRPASSRSSG